MGRKKSKKSREKNSSNTPQKARDVVSKLLKYEKGRRDDSLEEVTHSRPEYQYKADDSTISNDSEQLGDTTPIWTYFEKYNDERIKGAMSEVEQRATERIHSLETDINKQINELKIFIERPLRNFLSNPKPKSV